MNSFHHCMTDKEDQSDSVIPYKLFQDIHY